MLKVCRECGERFEASNRGQRFCRSCAKKRRKERDRLSSNRYYNRLSKEEKDHRMKIMNIWIKAHADEVRQYKNNYRKNNPDKMRRANIKYRKNNVAKIREYLDEYCKRPEVKIRKTKYHRNNIIRIGGSKYNIRTCPEEIRPAVTLALYLRSLGVTMRL
jgi:hypothetical protein